MDYMYYDNAIDNRKFKLSEKMVWIGCPNCKGTKDQSAYRYSVDLPVKNGFTNPSNHFIACVSSSSNLNAIVEARQCAKLSQNEQDDGSKKTRSKQPSVQQTLSGLNFLPSECILSIDMCITKIVIKNMPIYDIECLVERDMVQFPKVKSMKTVLDTSHHLVAIVEEKIGTVNL